MGLWLLQLQLEVVQDRERQAQEHSAILEQEIKERKKTEESLRESEEKYHSLIAPTAFMQSEPVLRLLYGESRTLHRDITPENLRKERLSCWQPGTRQGDDQ